MAKNLKHYSCDYCDKQGLEYSEVTAVSISRYYHYNNVTEHRPSETIWADLCNSCEKDIFKSNGKSLISILKSIWQKIT